MKSSSKFILLALTCLTLLAGANAALAYDVFIISPMQWITYRPAPCNPHIIPLRWGYANITNPNDPQYVHHWSLEWQVNYGQWIPLASYPASCRGFDITLTGATGTFHERLRVKGIRANGTVKTMAQSSIFDFAPCGGHSGGSSVAGGVQIKLPDGTQKDIPAEGYPTGAIESDVGGTPTLVPDAISLSQNYPNPFNPSTQIAFTLPEAAHTKLEVFNTLGQSVAMLVNETLSDGWHIVKFDATELPSGTYLYRLEAGGHVEMKKMMLMK